MTNILLILLLVHYILYFLFKDKRDTNVLGCGIFAWSGLKPGQFNKHKFDIVGIWNETRGEHSCGVSAEGRIQVGTKQLKVYRDFVANGNVPRPIKIPATMGHTRYATVGEHNVANAHPFGFGETEKEKIFEFVGVHNGSLLNHRELAKEFGIDLTIKEDGVTRSKIDSEILLEILYTTGNFKVLSRYNGAAALIWQFLEEPDVTYYYHGSSKAYEFSKDAVEERPLYYYTENKNSLYVSSIYDSLISIGGSVKDVDYFDYNTVYKVKNGDVKRASKFKISRHSNYQKRTVTTKYDSDKDYSDYTNYNTPTRPNKTAAMQRAKNVANATSSLTTNIYKEEPYINPNNYKGKVYFNKLRYWRNGHRITGIYTLVKGYGFYYLGDDTKQAEKTFWNYVNKLFVDGAFWDAGDLSIPQLNKSTMPFKHGGNFPEIKTPLLYSFFDGVMMEHSLDYTACLGKEKRKLSFNLADLSTMAKHPIMDINYTFREANDQKIYRDGILYSGTSCPLESNRVYTVLKGNLIETTDLTKTVVVHNLIEDVAAELEEELNATEEAMSKSLVIIREKDKYISNDLLEEDIMKMFSAAYDNFPRYKETLKKYGANPRALQASAIITTFLNGTYQLLSVEPKE